MLQPQLINMVSAAPNHAPRQAKRAATENSPTTFGDVMEQGSTPATKKAGTAPEAEQVKPPEQELPEDDNLLAFPAATPAPEVQPPVEEQPDFGLKVRVPHLSLFSITQAIVSILERYPNDTPPDTEIVPLLEEYLRQFGQLEQPLPPELQELQAMLEEVLARMPQSKDIAQATQQPDKLAQLIEILRGYLSPLENANEDTTGKTGAPEAEIIPLKPLQTAENTSRPQTNADEDSLPRENKQQTGEIPAQIPGARFDIQPHKVLSAERMAMADTPRFMPLTAENLFEAMIERITALPDAEPHMEIALKPDNLGKLSIDLHMGEKGLTAKIIASDEGVRNMLAAHLNRLSDSLAEKGIRIENVEVVYTALADKSFQHKQPEQREQGKTGNRLRTEPLWGTPETVPAGWETAFGTPRYMDDWGLGLSSVEYRA